MSNQFQYGKIDSTLTTIQFRGDELRASWFEARDGEFKVNLGIGSVDMHLSPLDALRVADMLERVVRDFEVEQQARQSAEYELQAGLRDAYSEPETNVEYAA